MLWIVVLLMCCQRTVESKEDNKPEIIVGRLGEELVFSFSLSDLRDEYNKYIAERDGKKIIQNEIQIQDLKKESHNILFKNKMESMIPQVDGKPTYSVGNQTQIIMTNDVFVVKKTKLQKEDAGMYWIEFRSIRLGQKVLIFAELFPPNEKKAEDNSSTILQLECRSGSTSIEDLRLVYNSMYIMWYKNGMKMTDLDPTLSQINVTVDHNGGNFVCLATDHLPCYLRLNTTKYYDVLNIEECDNVYDSETFFVKPQLIEVLMPAKMNNVIVAVTAISIIVIVVAVIVMVFVLPALLVVIIVITYKKYRITDNSIYETPDLRQGELLPEQSRLIIDENIYESIYETPDLREGELLPEHSRLIIDESEIYETPVLPQGEPLPGTSRVNYSRNEKPENHKYDVLLGVITPSVYTGLNEEAP